MSALQGAGSRRGRENTTRRLPLRLLALLLGMVITVLLVLAAAVSVPVKYEARATIMMLPGAGNIPENANPFLFLGGLAQAREVLVKIANSEVAREGFLGNSLDTDYAVVNDAAAGAPLIVVTATGPRHASALTLRDMVLTYLPEELERLQDSANTPGTARIETMVLVKDPIATRVDKSRTRGMVAAGVLGVGLTFLAVAGADLVMRRRAEDEYPDHADGPGQSATDPDRGPDQRPEPGEGPVDHSALVTIP